MGHSTHLFLNKSVTVKSNIQYSQRMFSFKQVLHGVFDIVFFNAFLYLGRPLDV